MLNMKPIDADDQPLLQRAAEDLVLLGSARVMEIDDIGKTEFYRRCRDGEYAVFRDGNKDLKISLRSVLERRKKHLRPAVFGALRGIRGVPPKHGKAIPAQ
jgi:hypothetical protein